MKVNYDLTRILKPEYAGKWIALNEEQTEVVATGKTPGEAREKAREKGTKDPVIMFGVEDYGFFYPKA